MKLIKFKILGKKWTLESLPTKQYRKEHGRGSVAITDVNKRIISLSPDGTDQESITHEIFHAYLGEICSRSADLDNDAFEEICAELFAKRGREMLLLSNKLHKLVTEALVE